MLTLTDVNLGIRDLLDKRNADLLLTKAGKYYHPLLEEQRDALDALPTALTGGVPFAAELDLIDARHDGYGATIYFVTEVYLRLPDAPAAIVEAAWERPHGVPDPPYLGLSAFGPAQEGLLFGRDDDVARLHEACRTVNRDPASIYTTSLNLGCILAPGEAADSPRARAQAGGEREAAGENAIFFVATAGGGRRSQRDADSAMKNIARPDSGLEHRTG